MASPAHVASPQPTVSSSPSVSIAAAAAHRDGPKPDALALVNEPAVNIAIWRRTPPGHDRSLLESWARQLGRREWLFDDLDKDDLGLSRFDVDAALGDLPTGPDWSMLHEDITALCAQFRTLLLMPRGLFEPGAPVSPGRHVLVRLAGVTDDACRKFHSDRVSLRLITTYVGPGTEWLPEGQVWRVAPRDLPMCVRAANAMIAPHPEHIQRLTPGDVAVLKGLVHPHVERGEVPAVVHRSPPIDGENLVRLVFSITADLGAS